MLASSTISSDLGWHQIRFKKKDSNPRLDRTLRSLAMTESTSLFYSDVHSTKAGSSAVLTCGRDLSDITRSANQHGRARHTSSDQPISKRKRDTFLYRPPVSSVRSESLVFSFRWTVANQGGQADQSRKKSAPVPRFCWTLRQQAEQVYLSVLATC